MHDMITFKSYKCNRCDFKKDYFSSPLLTDKQNIFAANCPNCQLGIMVIDFDDDSNFTDNYLERYFHI